MKIKRKDALMVYNRLCKSEKEDLKSILKVTIDREKLMMPHRTHNKVSEVSEIYTNHNPTV